MVSKEVITEEWIKACNALNPYLDINGVRELRELVFNLRNNEKFILISDNVDYNCNKEVIELKNNIPIFKDASDRFKILGLFSKSKVYLISFSSVYDIIIYSCVGEIKRNLSDDEKNKIYHSNLVPNLTLSQDISSISNQHFKFNNQFKQMNKLKWNDVANKLNNRIYKGLFNTLSLEFRTDNEVTGSFGFCADYLACCRAFNDNRLEVMPEDVVEAWFLTCNLFLMDLRPYIDGFENLNYIEENSFKSDSIKNNDADNDSIDEESTSSSFIQKFFGAIISIIIVGYCF